MQTIELHKEGKLLLRMGIETSVFPQAFRWGGVWFEAAEMELEENGDQTAIFVADENGER